MLPSQMPVEVSGNEFRDKRAVLRAHGPSVLETIWIVVRDGELLASESWESLVLAPTRAGGLQGQWRQPWLWLSL